MSNDTTRPADLPDALGRRIESLSPEKRALLAQQLRARAAARSFDIPRRADQATAPVSFAQELLWLLDRSSPGLSAYNASRALRLRGPLDDAALGRALDALVARHEALRTTFDGGDGEPRQIVHAPAPVAVERIDLRGVDASARFAEAERAIGERGRRAFDLAHETQFRVTLVSLADDDHILFWASHHIAVDAWSATVMFRELAALYEAARRGTPATLPALPITYGDYAAWQRGWLAGDRLDSLLGYWRERLAGAPELLELPTDFPRPVTPSFEGAQVATLLPPTLTARLKQVAQQHDATLYTVLVSAYVTLLSRYTGQDDIVIGSPVAGRNRAETEGMVGYFANTLVLRADLRGDPTFGELLGRVRETWLGAVEHQDIPLEKMVMELRRDRQLAHAPLFQVALTMEDAPPAPAVADGLAFEPLHLDSSFAGSAKFDLLLLPADRAEGLRLLVQYRTDLHRAETVERFLGHLRTLLEAVADDASRPLSQLPLLADAERAQLAAWNETAASDGAPATLVQLFEAQAARVAGRLAVVAPSASAAAHGSVAGSATLTYRELNARANQLAHHLRTTGVGPNVPVGLLLDRSADAIVGLLGILKAGGAYVPLSVDAPAARIATQLAESGASVVVTHAALADRVPSTTAVVALDGDAATLGTLPDANPAPAAGPDDLAYVLYTSGSTGVPKGVAVTHANAVHYARAVSRVLGVDAGEPAEGRARQYGLASTLAADLGNTSLLPALLGGATLHVLGKDVTTEPERFAQYMGVHPLDVLKLTPNHLRALVAGRAGAELAAVLPRQWVVTGGEALAPAFARQLLGAGTCRVLNHYGPTETTVGVLTSEATPASLASAEALGAQTVPLGRPLANTHAYVVDARGTEQPVGVPGELWLGGAGVARGYLNRAELTAERFVDFRGERVYRTGDRVRRLADGTIEFLGRTDDQVKVRGYRVELGEIEQALRAHPGVETAVAVLRAEEGGDARLVAYAVPKQGGYAVSHADRATPERLREWAGAHLPEYMVPGAVVLLDRLPLTPNGKVDRAALPAADGGAAAEDGHVAPTTETETQLAAIWADVLKKERVGVTDNFLALGGHSLLAIRILGKLSRGFGVRLPLRALFDAPTVQQLARLVDDARAAAAAGSSTPGA